jgi:hypothetical protein
MALYTGLSYLPGEEQPFTNLHQFTFRHMPYEIERQKVGWVTSRRIHKDGNHVRVVCVNLNYADKVGFEVG